jgi:hypothetical protein
MPDRRHLYPSILDAQHWVRAAQALSAIGGEGARAALEAAASTLQERRQGGHSGTYVEFQLRT